MDDHIKEIAIDKEAKHKLKKLKDIQRYYQKYKNDPEYQAKNRERQTKEYHNNPEYRQKKLDIYRNNKYLVNTRSAYNKYKRENRLNLFIERHPDKYEFLVNHDRKRYEVISEPTEQTDPEPAVAPE